MPHTDDIITVKKHVIKQIIIHTDKLKTETIYLKILELLRLLSWQE